MPILTSKFFIPPLRPRFVARPRLLKSLHEGLYRKLTLVSAPAGFGKTSLLSAWAATTPRRVIWLSLTAAERDLIPFLTHLVTALQPMITIGDGLLARIQAGLPAEAALTALLNEIATRPEPFIFILDDYHLSSTPSIDDTLTFLVENAPPHLHIVIATREDPPLPLARLRARDQVSEVRAADLRFTSPEVAEFLNHVMHLNLTAEAISALGARTEGWIAGLQMAAIATRGHQDRQDKDAEAFVQAFTGNHPFVMDYLTEEVLQQQPEPIQRFLLRTALLDHLCGPLCDALLQDSALSGQETLEYLQQANLFIVPLDDQREWFRYHHLFADLLRRHLFQEASAAEIADLNLRASRWYEQNGLAAEALQHALAANDVDRAAALLERLWAVMDGSFQSAAWAAWVDALPAATVRNYPALSVGYAWALMDSGELEASEARLNDAEQDLARSGALDRPNDPDVIALRVRIASARAYCAQARGETSAAIRYTQHALDILPPDDFARRETAISLLGMAYWSDGKLDAAFETFSNFIANTRQAGNAYFVVAATFVLAEIRIIQGQLGEAIRICQGAIQLAARYDVHVQRVTTSLHLALAMLYHERGDSEAARRALEQAELVGKHTPLVDWPHRWALARARLQESEAAFDAALALLDEAQQVYVRVPVPDSRPLAAQKAKIYVRQGRLAQAQAWANGRGLRMDDDLHYLREFEHLTLARVQIAADQQAPSESGLQAAIRLLGRLAAAAETGGRIASLIEILLVTALAHATHSQPDPAHAALGRALSLAAPEGFFRIFVDEGPPIRALLATFKPDSDAQRAYVNRLLAAFPPESPAAPPLSPSLLIDPLSPRELEVLRLIAEGLSNQAISERLFLALSSVKGHNQRIFEKLQVSRRTEAVARARALGIL